MKIYDSVVINSENFSYKIINELKKECKRRFIKIYNNHKTREYCERDTLKINIINDKIFVENKEITIKEIFKKYNFVSNLFSNIEDKNIYQKEYAQYITNKKKQAEKIISKYKIRNNFDNISGGVYISDEEYYLLKESKLKNVIFSSEQNCYDYVIPNENGYILRGSSTYYYLLANKGKSEKVSVKHFENFIDNYKKYFKLINNALDNVIEDNDLSILILSVLDNLRNYLLVLINALVISNQACDETLIYEFTNSKHKKLLDDITDVYSQMTKIINNDNYDIKLIKKIITNVSKYNFLSFIKKTDVKFYDKMLKSHRESDCFLENFLTVLIYLKKNKKDDTFIGTLYGGIEIPLIAYFMKNKKSKIIYITLFGVYNERHKRKLKYEDIIKKVNNKLDNNKELKCVLCDDNMLTGKTIQYIIDSLFMKNIYVDKILLVNHVNMNRIYQIIDNKTLLDLSLIDKYIYGLYFGTKYSKVKFGENIKNCYLDEFGLFDLSKEYICYYLYKNKIFSKESRIYNYTIGGKND